MEWHIIGILVFVVIYNIYRYYHEAADKDLLFSILEMPNGVYGSLQNGSMLFHMMNTCVFVRR